MGKQWLNLDPIGEKGDVPDNSVVVHARSTIDQQNPAGYDAFLETWTKAAHNNLTVEYQLTSGMIFVSDHENLLTGFPYDVQFNVRLKSKFSISLRGDTKSKPKDLRRFVLWFSCYS